MSSDSDQSFNGSGVRNEAYGGEEDCQKARYKSVKDEASGPTS